MWAWYLMSVQFFRGPFDGSEGVLPEFTVGFVPISVLLVFEFCFVSCVYKVLLEVVRGDEVSEKGGCFCECGEVRPAWYVLQDSELEVDVFEQSL